MLQSFADRQELNTRLNLGVFNKGRASSPTRPCICKSLLTPDACPVSHGPLVTGPAFSEVDFLSGSQQNRQEPAKSCDKGKNKATDQTKHASQMQISQYFSNDYPEDDLAAQATYSVKQDEPGRRSSCVPRITVPTSQQDAPPANVDDYACKNDKQSSCSATLFTWLERVPEEYPPQDAPKPCTKGALCADLSHQHISNEEKENKRYWDLWELKLILQIRQETREKMGRKKRRAFYEDILKRKRQASEAEEELTSPPKKPRTRPDAFTQPVQSRSPRSLSTLQSQAFVLRLEEELGRSLGDLLQLTAEEDPWFSLGSQPPELTPGDEMTASMESLSLESTPEYPAYTDNIKLFPDSGPIAFEHVHPYSNDAEYAKYSIRGAEDLGLGLDMLTRTDSRETLYDGGNDVIMKGVGAIFDRGQIDSANGGGRPSATDQNDPLLSTFGQNLESSMMPVHYPGPFPDEGMFFGQPIQHVAGGHSRRNSLY